MKIIKNTKVEPYLISDRVVWVKREDLCMAHVRFSKMRGVFSHMKNRKEKTIGVLDTFHSKAGWGVSLAGRSLGKKVVLFYPKFKGENEVRFFQRQAEKCGAVLIPLPAQRSSILFHKSKKMLIGNYEDSYMMPNALKLDETVTETAQEVMSLPDKFFGENYIWVVSVSSGTIAAGVISGLIEKKSQATVYLHMGYDRSEEGLRRYLGKKVLKLNGLFSLDVKIKIKIINEKYNYKDSVKYDCPFPCNIYYDLKAWKWLCENISFFKDKEILFWNIGS